MTGTQELSIHEGMQVMHELENQQQQKKNGKVTKKKTAKPSEEIVFNLDTLQADTQKNQDQVDASG